MNRRIILLTAASVLAAAASGFVGKAEAKCSIARTGQVDVIGNAMPVVDHMAKAMSACTGSSFTVNVKVTDKARAETEQAFSAVSPFEVAQVSNGVFVNLHAKGQLQPITDLVAKYKTQYKLEDRMLVTVGNDVFGIAFMANAQHMFYRKDALEKAGVQPPKTYDELLAALPKLRAAGFETPFTAAYKSGWDLATEFTNIYLGTGANALKALDTMTKLKGFMSPNALALASADVTTAFQQGQAAIGILWGTRAAAMDDANVSKVANQIEFAPAPAMSPGGKPSNAVWWDAFVMPRQMDGDREAAFLVMMEAVSEQTMKDGMNAAVWLRSGYTPGRHSKAVIDTVTANAAMWPDQPYFSLAHAAVGKAAADVLSGAKPAAQALADAEREYMQTARERGFLR
jgi:multiple sugar transport system substrate-binding protein